MTDFPREVECRQITYHNLLCCCLGHFVLVLLPVELISQFRDIYCRDQFIDYWIRGNMLAMDLTTQIYTILKQPYRTYLAQVCFLLYAVICIV